jgi:hypothetical protein
LIYLINAIFRCRLSHDVAVRFLIKFDGSKVRLFA